MKNHVEIIPQQILESDIVGGDLNGMDTNMERIGVYQARNIGILKQKIKQPKGTSDHFILKYEKILPVGIEQSEKQIIIQDKKIIKQNWENLINLTKEVANTQFKLKNPLKVIKIQRRGYINECINYYEDYETIKNSNQEKYKEEHKKQAKQLGMLIRNDQIGSIAYDKLASIMQIRTKKPILDSR